MDEILEAFGYANLNLKKIILGVRMHFRHSTRKRNTRLTQMSKKIDGTYGNG